MSWSRPVIATVVNRPARNCFQKKRLSLRSSKNHIRDIGLSLMAVHMVPKLNPICLAMSQIQRMTVPTIASVWSMSAQTSVFTPPRKV